MSKLRGIYVNVYRANSGDATNGGLTSVKGSLILAVEGGDIEIDEDMIYLKIDSITFKGVTSYHAKPVNFGDENKMFMYGGNFISTSDSRFKFDALKVHDRQE